VLLAYVDESGSRGFTGSSTFSLGCVLLNSTDWPDVFDEMIGYRRFLNRQFGIPVRAEIKANHLIRNKGAFFALGLSEQARFAVYRGLMRLQPKLGLLAFGIVIRKDELAQRGRTDVDPHDVAWEYLIQRFERITERGLFDQGGPFELMVCHDEGHELRVRALARKARRMGTAGSMFGTGSLRRNARRIVDDPVARDSRQSYFVQLADLNAYAAFRAIYPPPPRLTPTVPQTMWDELGEARYWPVNRHKHQRPLGVVVWPR
jgi:hypothetical protein